MFKSYSMELGGRTLTLEFGKYAEQASGATFVRYGDTCILVTATVADIPYDLIIWEVQSQMECHRELHYSKIAGKVPARHADF